MGQNISTEAGVTKAEEIVEEEGNSVSASKHAKHASHEFFLSNGNLESVGDIDSILQAMSVTPTSPESKGFSCLFIFY